MCPPRVLDCTLEVPGLLCLSDGRLRPRAEDSASRSAPTGVTVTDSADIRILEVGGEVLDTLPEWSLSDDTARGDLPHRGIHEKK